MSDLKRSDLYVPSGQLMARPHEMGKIKIGRLGETRQSKAGGSYQQPEKLDHFLITHKDRDTTGNFIIDAESMAAIGEPEPKRLRIFLPYRDPDLNLLVFYAAYAKSRCLCRGNGSIALRFDDTTSTYRQTPCAAENCEKYKDKKCKLTGILNVVLSDVPRIGGVHVFRTTSFYSIASLQSSMAMLLMQTEGNISGLPLELVIRPETKQPDGGVKVLIYTVNIEFAGTIGQLRTQALALAEGHATFRSRLALAENNVKNSMAELIEAPPEEDDADAVEAEFYPEKNVTEPTAKPALTEPQARPEPEPEPAATTEAATAPAPAKISDAQRRLLFARAKMNGKTEEDIKFHVLAAGFEHTADITKGECFDKLLAWADSK